MLKKNMHIWISILIFLLKVKKEKSYSLDVDRRFDYIPFGKYNLINFKKEFIVPDDIDCTTDIEIVFKKAELVFSNETYSLENGFLTYYKSKIRERNRNNHTYHE